MQVQSFKKRSDKEIQLENDKYMTNVLFIFIAYQLNVNADLKRVLMPSVVYLGFHPLLLELISFLPLNVKTQSNIY